MYRFIFLVLGLTISPVLTELESFDGPCPSSAVGAVRSFNQALFQEIWYVIQRYERVKWMDCAKINYEWNYSRRYFNVNISQKKLGEGMHRQSYTIDEQEVFSNVGKYIQHASIFVPTYHYIVDTDYKKYAVVWTCVNKNNNKNQQNLLVLARDRYFDINSLESLNSTLAKSPFDRSKLKYIEQKDKRC